jgi:iron complex outermembrane receptor protein
MSSGTLVPRLDMFYRGERTNNALTNVQRSPDDIIPSYTMMNARLTYLSSDRKWTAALAAENLLDKFYWAQIGTATNNNGTPASSRIGLPGRGREVSFNVRRSFF